MRAVRSHDAKRGGPPALLTVEEAGELLRIGRTKAYAMAREWRDTDGRSGLPVIDLGHVLRVPRQALEDLIGADLSNLVDESRVDEAPASVVPANSSRAPTSEPGAEPAKPPSTTRRTRRRQNRITDQLDLFDPKPRSG